MQHERYGLMFPPDVTDLDVELYCFRHGTTIEEGGLGKFGHFKRIVDILWNPIDEDTGERCGPMPVDWHPWFERMVEHACQHDTLGIAGCANSGKSDFAALWCIVNFICAPQDTMVLVTSTSKQDSRKRIWGRIKKYWLACPGLPGKLVDSQALIRFVDQHGDEYEDRGISLVAADRKKTTDEEIGKNIGFKAPRMFLVADELPELSHALITAATSNLANNEYFQLIGIGNPASYFDPFGEMCEPEKGWESISMEDTEWKSRTGYVIRFDAYDSPNIHADKIIYRYLPTIGKINAAKKKHGENSLAFWRMQRGFWNPSGAEEGIYSETEFIRSGVMSDVVWQTEPVMITALDPAFVTGGDRAVQYFASVGRDVDGKMVIRDDGYIELYEDMDDKENPKNFQIAKQFRDNSMKRGVEPKNAGFDSTGGGAPFGDIVKKVWSPDVLWVNFHGGASDRPVSQTDDTKSYDRYENRVSELWFGAKELLRMSQIRNMKKATIKEACARTYKTKKKGEHIILKVEEKKEMKSRLGKSPDIADAWFILLEVARQTLGFGAGEDEVAEISMEEWDSMVLASDVTSQSENFLETENEEYEQFDTMMTLN